MDDYSLAPVEHQPDFENVSLVPVDHDPFRDEDATQQAQGQQAQTEPAQSGPQPPQTATGRIYVGPLPKNPQPSEANPSTAWTRQSPAPTQVGYNGIPQAIPPSEPTPDAVTPQQTLQGAINQFYPGGQFTDLAQQAYKNGQYGNAFGYGVGAVADSLLALTGGKFLGAGIAAGVGALRNVRWSSRALGRALERAGHVRQIEDRAHHIVAKKANMAKPAYAILQKFGISIDDAANGVFLHVSKHERLHNNKYYEAVNKALANAKSKAEAEEILEAIRQGLKAGTFP